MRGQCFLWMNWRDYDLFLLSITTGYLNGICIKFLPQSCFCCLLFYLCFTSQHPNNHDSNPFEWNRDFLGLVISSLSLFFVFVHSPLLLHLEINFCKKEFSQNYNSICYCFCHALQLSKVPRRWISEKTFF